MLQQRDTARQRTGHAAAAQCGHTASSAAVVQTGARTSSCSIHCRLRSAGLALSICYAIADQGMLTAHYHDWHLCYCHPLHQSTAHKADTLRAGRLCQVTGVEQLQQPTRGSDATHAGMSSMRTPDVPNDTPLPTLHTACPVSSQYPVFRCKSCLHTGDWQHVSWPHDGARSAQTALLKGSFQQRLCRLKRRMQDPRHATPRCCH